MVLAKSKNWIETIIDSCDFKGHTSDFSEFETYGEYCAVYHSDFYKKQKLSTFRGAGYIRGRHPSEEILDRLLPEESKDFTPFSSIFDTVPFTA